MFYGRTSAEPLAFSLQANSVDHQSSSPLFAKLSGELRNMIYEYVFTDSMNTTENNPIFQGHAQDRITCCLGSNHDVYDLPPTNMGVFFLHRCKAVYLETYKYPSLLNPVNIYFLYSTRKCGTRISSGLDHLFRCLGLACIVWHLANLPSCKDWTSQSIKRI